ncbi:MAG: FdhF/YdeP family oxidoreductase [Planctomycetota bacterium]
MKRRVNSGGGWAAIGYTLRMARKAGWWRLWKAMSSKNACKTCALGMGGQQGGMRNEAGHWPEVCKKSLQAMVADMQDGIREEYFQRYPLRALQTFSPRELESSGRLVQPIYAGPGEDRYRVIDWTEALRLVADRLQGIRPNETFFYFSGRSSNEASFLLQLFARLYGTNNVNNCSYYCHQASGVGLTASLGTGTATVVLDDVERSDLFFLIGGNPASNHPRLMRSLMQVRRHGGKVIVINPVRETGLVNFRVPSDVKSLFFGSPIATQYVQPHIGGDIALLAGIAKVVLQRGALDREFIDSATAGFQEFKSMIESTDWDTIERRSGIEKSEIETVAESYIEAENVVFGWTMGITHHEFGVQNVQMIVNLALLRGMVGKPAAGLLPIRGHSNVQGIGSMGVTPTLKAALFDRLENHFGVQLPTEPGLDTMGCMQAANSGRMRLGICLGGNLYGSNPDSKFARRALGEVETMVYLTTTLNTGHAHGLGKETLVLPVLARDEELQKTTQESMFNYVRLSDGGKPRHPGPRSEVSIIATIAESVLGNAGPVNWNEMKQHDQIRAAIATIVPGYEEIRDIASSKQEFQIPGRTFHSPHFATPDGKAHFKTFAIPEPAGRRGELRLMTVRSEGQFNTVVYEEEDLYRGQERRDVVLMNRRDIERLGLKVDQQVTVRSAVGVMEGMLVREFDIKQGNCMMYYPEANVLVPSAVDPASKTPSFKMIPVTIETYVPKNQVIEPDRLFAIGTEKGIRREYKAC